MRNLASTRTVAETKIAVRTKIFDQTTCAPGRSETHFPAVDPMTGLALGKLRIRYISIQTRTNLIPGTIHRGFLRNWRSKNLYRHDNLAGFLVRSSVTPAKKSLQIAWPSRPARYLRTAANYFLFLLDYSRRNRFARGCRRFASPRRLDPHFLCHANWLLNYFYTGHQNRGSRRATKG